MVLLPKFLTTKSEGFEKIRLFHIHLLFLKIVLISRSPDRFAKHLRTVTFRLFYRYSALIIPGAGVFSESEAGKCRSQMMMEWGEDELNCCFTASHLLIPVFLGTFKALELFHSLAPEVCLYTS